MASWRKPVRLALVSIISLGLLTLSQIAVGADDDDTKSRGGCKGSACPKPGAPTPSPTPEPPLPGGSGVESVDPRIANHLAELAQEKLGDRYVHLWRAEDQKGVILGVHAPTAADMVFLRELTSMHLVVVAECPISLAELETAVDKADKAAGRDLLAVGPDYVNSRVRLGVTWDQVDRIASEIRAADNGLWAVTADEAIPESKPGRVVVVVEAAEIAEPAEVLNPAESLSSGPLRAGKRIPTDRANGQVRHSGCTSNALVKVGNTRYMLTGGHCGAVGDHAHYPFRDSPEYRYDISTWFSAAENAEIEGDIARFRAPADAEASIYVGPKQARSITGWATAEIGDQVFFFGQTTNTEKRGLVTAVRKKRHMGKASTGYRWVLGLSLADFEVQSGDSGAPVYMKLDNGDAVLVGIICALDGFCPIHQAWRATGTELVTSGSTLEPVYYRQTGSTPLFDQIVLSEDFTGDGRGEIVTVDTNGWLVFHEAKANGAPKRPAYLDGKGFGGQTVYAPGNWDGKGRADIVTITKDGRMWLHPRGTNGVLGTRQNIGQGWGGHTPIPVGDVNGDGNPDLLVIRESTGDLYLYAGNGKGGFKYPYPKVGYGWKGFTLYAAGDLNGDKKADILSIDGAGNLWYYRGKGNGTFEKKIQVGNSWNGYYLAAGADLNGDGLADIIGRDSAERLYFYKAKGSGFIEKKVLVGTGW